MAVDVEVTLQELGDECGRERLRVRRAPQPRSRVAGEIGRDRSYHTAIRAGRRVVEMRGRNRARETIDGDVELQPGGSEAERSGAKSRHAGGGALLVGGEVGGERGG